MGLPVNTSASRWCLTTVPKRSDLLVNSKAQSFSCRTSRALSRPVCPELSCFSRIMIASSMLTVSGREVNNGPVPSLETRNVMGCESHRSATPAMLKADPRD